MLLRLSLPLGKDERPIPVFTEPQFVLVVPVTAEILPARIKATDKINLERFHPQCEAIHPVYRITYIIEIFKVDKSCTMTPAIRTVALVGLMIGNAICESTRNSNIKNGPLPVSENVDCEKHE